MIKTVVLIITSAINSNLCLIRHEISQNVRGITLASENCAQTPVGALSTDALT